MTTSSLAPGHPAQTQCSDVAELLAGCVSSDTIVRRNEPLSRRTTLRVGGPADVYVEPASEHDLATVLKCSTEHGVPILMLGRGSNLLVRDAGYRGVVICLAHPYFSRIEVAGCRLTAGAGARMKFVALEAKHHGLSGMEFLEGIPGALGGGLRMNAGAMGSSLFHVVESVRLMEFDGTERELASRDLDVGYRECGMLKTSVAISAILVGQPDSIESIAQRMAAFSRKRWTTQPAAPSAGCIFRNPANLPAGRLIEELGLKGTRVGGAVVSAEHGNFIVTNGTATARDILQLIEIIKERAMAERQVQLQTEVEIVGDDE